MSLLKQNINYDGLEMELQDALSADTMYKLQNDAKLRALEQNVPTYEHFRQLVNGAHLKPLELKDYSKKVVEVNNKAVNHSGVAYCDNKLVSVCGNFENFPNKTGEFYQSWKKIDLKDKFNFLWNSRHCLVEIFVEIPASILEEFLDICLMEFLAKENVDLILELLDFIASCKRFQLAKIFMSDCGKELCRKLFEKLKGKVQNNSTKNEFFFKLTKKYQI